MIKIFGAKSKNEFLKGLIRDLRPIWILEELNEPYEHVKLDVSAAEHKQDSFLQINPFGKLPAMQDGDFNLFESSAICTYLGDKFSKLIPPAGTQDRARYHQWVAAATTTIEPHCSRVFACDYFYDKDEKTSHIRRLATEVLAEPLQVVDRFLSKNAYLVRDEFGIADVILSSVLRMLLKTELLENRPNLTGYLNRNFERPSFQKAYESNASM